MNSIHSPPAFPLSLSPTLHHLSKKLCYESFTALLMIFLLKFCVSLLFGVYRIHSHWRFEQNILAYSCCRDVNYSLWTSTWGWAVGWVGALLYPGSHTYYPTLMHFPLVSLSGSSRCDELTVLVATSPNGVTVVSVVNIVKFLYELHCLRYTFMS